MSIGGKRTSTSFHRELGRIMWEYCGMARNRKGLETALQKKPNFADAARFLGQVHYQVAQERAGAKDEAGAQAEYAKAVAPFEQAYKAEPDSVVNIQDLIDVYERTKQSDKAMTITRDAVAKEPKNKRANPTRDD